MAVSVTVVLASANLTLSNAAEANVAQSNDIKLLCAAREVKAVMVAVSQIQPRVLIFDLAPSHARILPAFARLPKPGTRAPRVLAIDDGHDERRALAMAKAGAQGYMSAEAIPLFLSKAIRRIAAGEAWFSRRLGAKIVDELHRLNPGRTWKG